MRRSRILNALVVLLIVGVFSGLWWDTVIDLDARQRAYDRIVPGMTLSQVEWLMRGRGETQFLKISGDPDYHSRQWKLHGVPRIYKWEDAYATIVVEFQAPEPNPPRVVRLWRETRDPPKLDGVWRCRFGLSFFWLLGFSLLTRGLLTAKPPVALNSPPTSDTKDGVDSPTD